MGTGYKIVRNLVFMTILSLSLWAWSNDLSTFMPPPDASPIWSVLWSVTLTLVSILGATAVVFMIRNQKEDDDG